MVEPSEGQTPGALKSETVSTKQRWIAELAKKRSFGQVDQGRSSLSETTR